MKTFLLRLLIIWVSLMTPIVGVASHIVGFDINYECLGANTYQINLFIYRDCAGVAAPNYPDLQLYSATCGHQVSLTLNKVGMEEVTPLCSSALSTCSGGTFQGIERHIYSITYTLPQQCNDWVLTYRDCCRNSAITNSVNPGSAGLYSDALINNLDAPCNNSPVFNMPPVVYVCEGQGFSYNHAVTDAEGDSLVYTLADPLDTIGLPVVYQTPFSAQTPISTDSSGPFTFAAPTGQIHFTASGSQIAITAVVVEEYRDGQLIGRVRRDMQIITVNCSGNIVPDILPPVNVSGGNYTNNVFTACAGDTLHFEINLQDANALDVLQESDNITSALPGATVTQTGTNPVNLSVDWPVPNQALSNYSFYVRVEDNACPVIGYQVQGYLIRVASIRIASSQNFFCPDSTTQISLLGTHSLGVGANYIWSPSHLMNNANGPSPTGTVNSSTTFSVTATDANGCILVNSIDIDVYDLTLAMNPLVPIYCSGDPPLQMEASVFLDGEPIVQQNCGPQTKWYHQIHGRHRPVLSTNNSFVFNVPSNTAMSWGTLKVTAFGDISSSSEIWEIRDENGNPLGNIGDDNQCEQAVTLDIPLTIAQLNSWNTDGQIVFSAVDLFGGIDVSICAGTRVVMELEYCYEELTPATTYTEQLAGPHCSADTSNFRHVLSFKAGVPDATSAITLSFCMQGDYSQSNEYVTVFGENSFNLGDYGETTAGITYSDCDPAFCQSISIPASLWNSWNNDGIVELIFETSGNVDQCFPNFSCLSNVEVTYQYDTATINPITYTWMPALGLSNPNIYNPLASPSAPTHYTCVIEDEHCAVAQNVFIDCPLLSNNCLNFKAQNGFLHWELADVDHIDSFVIQGSEDAVMFKDIDWVPVDIKQTKYHWPITRKQPYFKLMKKDVDGVLQQACDIIALKQSEIAPIRIWPNPTKNTLNIEHTIPEEHAGMAAFKITNQLGQQIYIGKMVAFPGEIDVQGLISGTYILQIKVGNHVTIHKFIKM